MEIELWAGLGLFVLGILIGTFFQRSFSSDSGKSKRLEQKLAETQEAYTKYQAEVSAHFMDTARKVQNLNNSYREVHEQLAKGAGRLCSDDEANDFLSISFANSNKGRVYEEAESGHLPPMDYAPKETPDAEGTLSESFGLKDAPPADKDETSSETDTKTSASSEEKVQEPPRV